MALAVADLLEQGSPTFEAAMPVVSQLLKAEVAEREFRSITYHTKAARFPAYGPFPCLISYGRMRLVTVSHD